MMLEQMVTAPTAGSPPYRRMEELRAMFTRLSVDCMIKGDTPMATPGREWPPQTEIPGLQSQPGAPAQQKQQHPHCGEHLGEHRGQGGALHAHVKDKDKNGVENDVGHRTDDDREHGEGGEALGGDEIVQPQGDQYGNGPPEIDAQIFHGVADGVLTGAEEIEQGLLPELEHHGDRCGEEHQQRGAVAQNLTGQVQPALPHADGGP